MQYINNTPTKLYETEEGRFCNCCFNPETLRNQYLNDDTEYLTIDESLDPFINSWNAHLYLNHVWDKNSCTYPSVYYDDFPICELCGYVFQNIQLIDPIVLLEQKKCGTCGNSNIVETYLTYDLKAMRHACGNCIYLDSLFIESFKTFRKLYQEATFNLQKLIDGKNEELIKKQCLLLINYLEKLDEIQKFPDHSLDREDYIFVDTELLLLRYIVQQK